MCGPGADRTPRDWCDAVTVSAPHTPVADPYHGRRNNPESTIGKLADIKIEIPAQAKGEGNSGKSIQPMGSLFEQSLLLFYDAVILRFMEKKGLNSEMMYGRHANLE